MKYKKIKKLIRKKSFAFGISFWNLIVREIAKKEYFVFSKRLEKNLVNFQVEHMFSAAVFRIILIVAVNFAYMLWLGSGRLNADQGLDKSSKIFIPAVQEAMAAEPATPAIKVDNEGEIFSGYLMTENTIAPKQCKKDQAARRNSDLCGEDLTDEKLIAELELMDKEYQKQYAREHMVRKPVVRKISCHEENDHPSYSETKGKHTDEDCCPDPDEYPKPGCVYSPSAYAIMLKR